MDILEKDGMSAIWVVDGLRNPLKADEDAKRAAAAAVHERLNALYVANRGSDYRKVAKLRKRLSQVTEDMLFVALAYLRKHNQEICVAPFEADWQLIYLELIGKTQATLSTDSDMWLLGSKQWICALNSKGKCCIVTRESGITHLTKSLDLGDVVLSEDDALAALVLQSFNEV
jgi:5'-3' exonuclease